MPRHLPDTQKHYKIALGIQRDLVNQKIYARENRKVFIRT